MHFILPHEHITDNIPVPQPNDTRVNLHEIAEHTAIALRFSGLGKNQQFIQQQKILEQYCRANKISTETIAYQARYNPPWTLPFLRRHEIIFKILD